MTDIIIIGGGMSGLTAALYALRSGKTVLVMESESIGGQIATSPRVENFPSHKEISGAKLADETFEQVIEKGAEITLDKAVKIEKNGKIFTVTTEYGETFEALSVIIANGAIHRTLNLPREEDFIGKGVYYCAVCDGAFYKDQEVALVGDANSAMQYALYLSNICKKVTVLALFDKLFGDKYLQEKIKSLDNVEIFYNKSVKEYLGSEKLSGIKYEDTKTKEEFILTVPAVFIAIGQKPENQNFTNVADVDKNGYFISDESCETKTEGLFVAGDTRTKFMRQLTTACGDGAIAATKACQYVDKL